MIVTIDFDLSNFRNPELALWFLYIRLMNTASAANVRWIRVAETANGYHIYVAVNGCRGDPNVVRWYLMDDRSRMELDMRKRYEVVRNVLFSTKIVKRGKRVIEKSTEVPRYILRASAHPGKSLDSLPQPGNLASELRYLRG